MNQPEAPHAINTDQHQACHKFLINFESIYTINYDLLLYWVYVNHEKILFKDGFINSLTDSQELVWYQKNERFINLYYLHGALHLYQDGNDIKKHSSKYNKITLKNQIENKLQQNKPPLFVSGGTALSKEKTIRNNPYLHSAFNSFKQCDQALFIYGFGFNDNDGHII